MSRSDDDVPSVVRSFEKTVAIKATDDEERTATGVVLTPNELDHQLDFLRPDGIQAMFNPNPADGVMHAVWPPDAADLEFSRVLEEDQEIDGAEFGAGQWVIRRKYYDDELYGLVADGVLNAFSIGGDVTEEIQYESIEDLPEDVTIPGEVDPDSVPGKYWPPAEILNGYVTEISDVDIPAVPRATHAVVKALDDLQAVKSIVDDVDGEEEFVEIMERRGHDEADAERLWNFLSEHADAEKSSGSSDAEGADGEPDTGTKQNHDMTDPENEPDPDDPIDSIDEVDDATLGKRLKRFLVGGSEDEGEGPPDVDLATKAIALRKSTDEDVLDALKEGRPLNASNREALMAAHDAIESALASDVDFEMNRFTDNEDVEFSIEEFGKLDDDTREKLLKAVTPEQAEIVIDEVEDFVDTHGEATVGDFIDWKWEAEFQEELDADQIVALESAFRDWHEEMDPTEMLVTEEFASWLSEQTDNSDLEQMTDTEPDNENGSEKNSPESDTPEEPPEWAKALQEQTERNKERLDEIFGEPEQDVEKAMEQAPDWAKALYESTQQNTERIEQIGKQGGQTTQLGGGAEVEGDGEEPERKFDKAWDETFRVAERTPGGVR